MLVCQWSRNCTFVQNSNRSGASHCVHMYYKKSSSMRAPVTVIRRNPSVCLYPEGMFLLRVLCSQMWWSQGDTMYVYDMAPWVIP